MIGLSQQTFGMAKPAGGSSIYYGLLSSTPEIYIPRSGDAHSSYTPYDTAIGTNGVVYVGTYYDRDASYNQVFAMMTDYDGNILVPVYRLTTGSNYYKDWVAIDKTDDGFIVIWSENNRDGSNYGVYGQRLDHNANKVGSEFRVNNATTGNQKQVAVSAVPNGFMVAWYDDSNANDDIYAKVYNNDLSIRKNDFRVNTGTTSWQDRPSSASNSRGDVVIAWNSQDAPGAASTNRHPVLQLFDQNGNAIGSETLIGNVSSHTYYLDVEFVDDDTIVAYYYDHSQKMTLVKLSISGSTITPVLRRSLTNTDVGSTGVITTGHNRTYKVINGPNNGIIVSFRASGDEKTSAVLFDENFDVIKFIPFNYAYEAAWTWIPSNDNIIFLGGENSPIHSLTLKVLEQQKPSYSKLKVVGGNTYTTSDAFHTYKVHWFDVNDSGIDALQIASGGVGDILVIGSGGDRYRSNNRSSGGAGGLVEMDNGISFSAGLYDIQVGAFPGGTSSALGYTATGGGSGTSTKGGSNALYSGGNDSRSGGAGARGNVRETSNTDSGGIGVNLEPSWGFVGGTRREVGYGGAGGQYNHNYSSGSQYTGGRGNGSRGNGYATGYHTGAGGPHTGSPGVVAIRYTINPDDV